jgi:predicted TIM-barrel fold metal-dependent hydrolase
MSAPHLGAPAPMPADFPTKDRADSRARMPALPGVTRRRFFKTTLAATATLALGKTLPSTSGATLRDPQRGDWIDTNVTLGRWPFRRLPLDDTPALAARLRQHGVAQAWAGSFDGLWQRDIAGVNARLAEERRRHGRGLLVPFGSVNPTLPSWEEDLRRCHEQHQMPGIRLHPNYHGYKLDEPVFAKLLSRAGERGLLVQIAVSLEDERMQSALARVPEVDLSPLPALLKRPPAPRVVLLNWYRTVKGVLLKPLADTGEVSFDIATVEGVGGLANLLQQLPAEHVLFGSHAPFFYFESARLKLRESALNDGQMRMICAANARRLWPRP